MACLAGLFLIVAGLIYWRFDAQERASSDASTYTYYVCESCGDYFHLSEADIDRAMSRREFSSGGIGGAMAFKCPKCGQLKGVRASRCPDHGDIIKLNPGPRDPDKCSKCDFTG